MPEYIITENGRKEYQEYINELRAACDNLRNDPEREESFLRAKDMLFAALLYNGSEEELSENQLSSMAKEQNKRGVVNQNVEVLKALSEKEEKLIYKYGLPDYLQKIHSYGLDYSESEEAKKFNGEFEAKAAKYNNAGMYCRADFVTKSIQKVLDLRDEDLVPKNEAEARQYILENYHALHLGNKIDSLLESIGMEFDIIGPKELQGKDPTRRHFKDQGTVQCEADTIRETLAHKQKLIKNLLIYEKKWQAQYDPESVGDNFFSDFEIIDEAPDSKYDNIKINIRNIAENSKGMRLEKIGHLLEGSGMSLIDLEEIVRSRMINSIIEEKLAALPDKGKDASQEQIDAFGAEAEKSLDAEDVYKAMEEYARKVSTENREAERMVDPSRGSSIDAFEHTFAGARDSNDIYQVGNFFSNYASSYLNDDSITEYRKLFAYEKVHSLIDKFRNCEENFPIDTGNVRGYTKLIGAFEKMEELGLRLLGDDFDQKALSEDIRFMDHLVQRAEKEKQYQEQRQREHEQYKEYCRSLEKEGIDLSGLVQKYKDELHESGAQYRFVQGRGSNGLAVTEAFGDNPNPKDQLRTPNGQAFRVQLALLSAKEEIFGDNGDPFEKKNNFIHNMLTDPEFRKANKSLVTSQAGESLMYAYEKLEQNYKKDSTNPLIQEAYGDMMYKALKTANTVAMYNSADLSKLSLLSHAIKNINARFEKDPRLNEAAKKLELKEGYEDLDQVKAMNKGLIELAEIKQNALSSKIDIIKAESPDRLEPNSIGNFFAGKVVDLMFKQNKSEDSKLYKAGENPVNPLLLGLSKTLNGQSFSKFVGELIENTPTVKTIREKGFFQLRDLIIKENPKGLSPKELTTAEVKSKEYQGMQKLVDRIGAEVSSLIPKSLVDEIATQVKNAGKKVKSDVKTKETTAKVLQLQ